MLTVTKLSKLLIFVRKLITTETETKINEQEYLLRFTLVIRSCDAHLMIYSHLSQNESTL